MQTKSKIVQEVDIIKGIAILVVMMQHSQCARVDESLPEWFHIFLNSFSMPLFFIASGFLFNPLKDEWKTFLDKKLRRLIVPYIFFGLLTIATRYFLSDFTQGTKIDPVQGLVDLCLGDYYWFLYVLFIFMVVCKVVHWRWCLAVLCIASLIVGNIFNIESFIIYQLVHQLFYFIAGMFIKERYDALRDQMQVRPILITATTLIAFAVSICIDCKLAIEITGIIFMWNISTQLILHIDKGESPNSYIGNVGSVMVNILKHFGKYSLQYYLNHLRILTAVFLVVFKLHQADNNAFDYIVIVAIAVLTSYIMLLVEKQFRITRFLCGLK